MSAVLQSISVGGRIGACTCKGASSRRQPLKLVRAAANQAEEVAAPVWDPDGILASSPQMGGHFARRERELAAKLGVEGSVATVQHPTLPELGEIQRIPAEALAAGGIPASDASAYDRPAFAARLAERYMAVDLDQPGVRILNFDPPVLTVDSFFTVEQCAEMVEATLESGGLEDSRVGASYVASALHDGTSARRTSQSLLADSTVLGFHPRLRRCVKSLHEGGRRLLPEGDWTFAGKLPYPDFFCYESPQVARYETGQYFLEHEDAFPVETARTNQFQRRATILVYLNNVAQGGRTRFDKLDIAVQPECGKALIFFPALADCTPDTRTLHTAEDAGETKWITQQWVAYGFPRPPLDLSLNPGRRAAAARAAAAEANKAEETTPVERIVRAKKDKSGKKAAKKGFGQ